MRPELTQEIFGDLLVPERDISLVIVHDGTQFCVAGKVGHELVHALDALDDRLALRTFLDGRELIVVDWLVWGSIKGLT